MDFLVAHLSCRLAASGSKNASKNGDLGDTGQSTHVFTTGAQRHFLIDDRDEGIDHVSADAVVSAKIGKRDTAIAVHVELIERVFRGLSRFQSARDLGKVLRPLQN